MEAARAALLIPGRGLPEPVFDGYRELRGGIRGADATGVVFATRLVASAGCHSECNSTAGHRGRQGFKDFLHVGPLLCAESLGGCLRVQQFVALRKE